MGNNPFCTFTLVSWWETLQRKQCLMVWTSAQQTVSFTPSPERAHNATPPFCLHLLLPSKWFLPYYFPESTPHMSAHHSTTSHSLLKTVLGKSGDRYQAYCTTHKTHIMATCHGGTGHPLDRSLDILAEDPEHADIDNASTHSSDTTVALWSPEAAGHPEDPVYDKQTD